MTRNPKISLAHVADPIRVSLLTDDALHSELLAEHRRAHRDARVWSLETSKRAAGRRQK